MMQIPVKRVSEGMHPKEVVVEVKTRDGAEELMVDERSLDENMLQIGYPVGQQGDCYLVELPQETFRGYWRVWVPKSDVTESAKSERALA